MIKNLSYALIFFCKIGEKRYLCSKFTPINHEQKEQS